MVKNADIKRKGGDEFMDLLGFLKEKKGITNQTETHPFAYYNNYFKYLYCFGLGVSACGHMKAITETKTYFEEILRNIKLKPSDWDRIIIDINNNFDYKIKEVCETLDTRDKQYMFCADLVTLSSTTLWAQNYCERVTEIYMSIFKFNAIEKKFIVDFVAMAQKHNVTSARKIYHEFVAAGYYVGYALLKYICFDFLLEDTYGDLILQNGQVIILDKPTIIHGDVIIKNGSSLNLIGASVSINGSIQILGGRIRIKNSNIIVTGATKPNLLRIQGSAMVKIEESTIDCNFKCGMVEQENGYLLIDNSNILHTKGRPAVCFAGETITMNGTEIEAGKNGGVQILKESITNIDDCKFIDCEAEHGAAIHIDSLYDARISNCVFQNCRAKYIGGAVYFSYKKYGQNVYNCEFNQCFPKDSNVFNSYIEENNVIGQ